MPRLPGDVRTRTGNGSPRTLHFWMERTPSRVAESGLPDSYEAMPSKTYGDIIPG